MQWRFKERKTYRWMSETLLNKYDYPISSQRLQRMCHREETRRNLGNDKAEPTPDLKHTNWLKEQTIGEATTVTPS
jgi:hypothetical protein